MDRRTLTGRSVTNIAVDCGTDRKSLNLACVRSMCCFSPPPGEEWRIPLVKELLDIKDEKLEVPGISTEDIDQIIEDICCN